jgi:hypothetical protein
LIFGKYNNEPIKNIIFIKRSMKRPVYKFQNHQPERRLYDKEGVMNYIYE